MKDLNYFCLISLLHFAFFHNFFAGFSLKNMFRAIFQHVFKVGPICSRRGRSALR